LHRSRLPGALAAAPVQAQFGIGINLGTNGFGVEAKQSLSPSFDLRFGFSGLYYELDYEYDDVDYEVEQSLGSRPSCSTGGRCRACSA